MKEQLVKIIQSEGYDFISACGIANDFINRSRSLEPGIYTFCIGSTSIKISKENNNGKH